jgi:hypothetical protein
MDPDADNSSIESVDENEPHLQPDEHWVAIVDHLFETYSSIVKKHGLKVEFILDESGTHGMTRSCLQEKWRPWISTFISPRDPIEAFVFDEPSLGMDRFRILNEPVPGYPPGQEGRFIERAKRFNYGKFGTSKNTYPFLAWEPSKQQTIWDVSRAYLSGNYIHPAGFRFSINIDPVMFRIFVAHERKADNSAWNIALKGTHGARRPFVTVIPDENNESHTVTLFSLGGELQYIVKTANLDNTAEYHTITTGPEVPTKLEENDQVVTFKTYLRSSPPSIYMVTKKAHFYQFGYDRKLKQVDQVTTIPVDFNYEVLDSELFSDKNGNQWLLVITQSTKITEIDSITLELYKFTTRLERKELSQVHIQISGKPINSVSVTIAENAQAYLLLSSEMKVYGIPLSIDTSSAIINIMDPFGKSFSGGTLTLNGAKLIPLGIGSQVRVTSNIIDKQVYLSMVWDGGFCWNSATHNLQARRVCANNPTTITDPVCSSVNQRDVLQYTFGKMTDIIDRQVKSITRNGVLLSPCDNNIMHGSYDRGTIPSAATVLLQKDKMIRFVTVHQGSVAKHVDGNVYMDKRPPGPATTCLCGTAIHHSGLVLDSFTLPVTN